MTAWVPGSSRGRTTSMLLWLTSCILAAYRAGCAGGPAGLLFSASGPTCTNWPDELEQEQPGSYFTHCLLQAHPPHKAPKAPSGLMCCCPCCMELMLSLMPTGIMAAVLHPLFLNHFSQGATGRWMLPSGLLTGAPVMMLCVTELPFAYRLAALT